LVVSSLDGPITVALEPEGNVVELPEGDHLYMAFPGRSRTPLEVSLRRRRGQRVSTVGRGEPVVWRKDGTRVSWWFGCGSTSAGRPGRADWPRVLWCRH
jgi:hypothetical protein